MDRVAGIVLCGGKSSRMGRPKATLPFGPEPMLARVVRLLGQVVEPLVVVAAPQQQIPPLPDEVLIVRDAQEGRGPLEGLRAGLCALGDPVEAAYATSCDVPLLAPAFVRRMIGLFQESRLSGALCDIAVPWTDGFYHPLAAVYARSVLPCIERLLEEDRLRPAFLFEAVPTRQVPEEMLREADPQLHTLTNLNHPEDYEAALRTAGFELPREGS